MSEQTSSRRYALSPQQRLAWRRGDRPGEAGCVIDVHGAIDRARLDDALCEVVDRYEILRTHVETAGGLELLSLRVDTATSALHGDLRRLDGGRHELELRTTCLNADSTTFALLIDAIAARYDGRAAPDDTPVQYADYAAWANKHVAETMLMNGGEVDATSAVPLHASPPTIDAATITAHVDLPAPGEALALAAWQALCWAQHREPCAIAVRFSGRARKELGAALGPLERWLPIESAIDVELTVESIVEALARRLDDMAAEEDSWPCAATEWPDWGFAYTRVRTATGGGVAFRVRETWPRGGPARTTLEVTADEARATLALVYDAAQVPAAEAARRLAQYQALVTAAVAAPAQPVGVWLAGPRPAGPPTVAPGPDLITAVTATARTHPTRVAVQAGVTALTYAALVAQASRLAADLRAHGAGPETCVGLALDRAAPALVAWLAVLGAGAAVVPLDVEGPPARLAAQLAHARLALLLTTRRHRAALPPTTAVVLCLDADAPAADPQADAAPLAVPQSDQLAYILFTSGSTGTPKAVAVPHRALAHYAAALRQRLDAVSGAHWGFVSPLTADLGYTSLLGAWTTGGTLHLLDPSTPAAGATLDYLKITPPHLAAWLRALPAPATCLPRRALLLGGDAAPWPLLEQLTTLAPTLTLVNHYGPTETTIGVLTGPATPLPPPRPVAPPLGTPLAHVAAYILDAALDPVWPGAVGLLWIGGPSLARGYAHAPALTAAAFRPNPFATTPGARMYATGDRVRLGPDGAVEFLGRADRQLKLRGHRLEPAEIEAALARHPAVSTALVLPTRDQTPSLIAYLVGSAVEKPSLLDIRRFLEAQLPSPFIPAHIVWVDELPLTPSGKIDACRLAEDAPGNRGDAGVDPQSHIERALADIWAGILNREHIGVTDNFFLLGGDSIGSILVVARASQVGIVVTPKQLFDHPTIRELAAVASTTDAERPADEPVAGPVPLTPIQRWFFEHESLDPQQYNQSLWLDAREPIEPAALERAVHALIDHHDALRLRYVPSLDGWSQRQLARQDAVPLDVIAIARDGRGVWGETGSGSVAELAAALQASLDLVRGPLFRAALFRFDDGRPDRVLLIAHHLVVDGVSWSFLVEDLQRAYLQTRASARIEFAAKTASFQTWAEHLAARAHDAARSRERDEWHSPAAAIAADGADDQPTGTTATADTVRDALSTDLTARLIDTLCPAFGLQVHEALLALLAEAYWRWTGRSRLLVDLESHGRSSTGGAPDVSRTVGWFTVRFPVLLKREPGAEPDSVLASIKEQVRLVAARGVHYGLLRYLSGDTAFAADLAAMPRPEISVNYQGHVQRAFPPGSPFTAFAEEHQATRAPSTPRRFRYEMNALVENGRLELAWSFDRLRERRADIERLAELFREAAVLFVDHGSTPSAGRFTPSDFPSAKLSQDDLDRLLEEWNREFS